MPSEDGPRAIDPPVATGSPTQVASGDSAGPATEVLYLVLADRLVAVERRLAAEASPQRQLDDLVAGPIAGELDRGMSSALAGTDLIAGVRVEGGTAEVTFRPQAESNGRIDDVLAIGQIVCTLDARADVDTVRFLRDGEVLRVPRADGQLSDLPLTAADYAPLVTPR